MNATPHSSGRNGVAANDDDEKVGAKAPYVPAEIIDYGDLSDLTEANANNGGDSQFNYS
jgi:hypothetical protein